MTISMASSLALPANAVTEKMAFLGTSGSGKTYGAGVLVEGLLSVGAQVVVIDTVGNWWGLRVASDGVSPGFKIPVIGGDKGDLPLAPTHGPIIAQTIAQTRSSMVIDVSDFEDGELRRFVTAFAKALLLEKKQRPSPTMVVWEECQDIIPQTMYGDDVKMVGAVQRLIKRGRNYGIGTTLISQRVAAVNKGCLNQCETVFAFRTSAPLDRKAIGAWVNHVGTDKQAQAMLDRLPKLETGECIVYSPQWLKRVDIVKVRPKRSFNASSTPDFESDARPVELATVDLGELREKLATAVKEAEENDVGALKKKIAELEAMLNTWRATRGEAGDGDELRQEAERLVREVRQQRTVETTMRARISQLETKVDTYERSLRDMIPVIERLRGMIPALPSDQPADVLVQGGVNWKSDCTCERDGDDDPGCGVTPCLNQKLADIERNFVPNAQGKLERMDRAFLTALAQYGACTKARLRLVTGYAASGAVSTSFARLLRNGWVEELVSGELRIAQAGRNALGTYERLPRGDELRKYLLASSRLSTMEKKLLEATSSFYPSTVEKAIVRKKSGYAASGAVSTAFAKLIGMGYLTQPSNNVVRASDDLFDRGGRA